MKFLLKPKNAAKVDCDILIAYTWEKELPKLSDFPQEFVNLIKEGIAREQFEGKEGQSIILSTKGIVGAYKFLLMGLGNKDIFDVYKLYNAIASSVKRGEETKPVKIAVLADSTLTQKFQIQNLIQVIVESVSLSLYKFDKYKSEEERKKTRPVEEVIISLHASLLAAADRGFQNGLVVSRAVSFARDLVNEPSEVTSPDYLAKKASEIAKESHNIIKAKIYEKEEIFKLKMGAFLGVASGSNKPPKFIHMHYKPQICKKKIILIGKGITFDTGGLSLKSPEHMETMKLDMSGAAAILAVFNSLEFLKPKAEIVGLIAACENMPGPNALKPGDILISAMGKTIEVLNTDAEGRLTLADAISYANIHEKPDEIIDLATLTGACMVALGQDIAGIFGNDDKMLNLIEKSAKYSGEQVWRLPLFSGYKELIKSHIADIKNIQTGRYGGAITAALFLEEFAGKVPWVHFDIAGPAYNEKDTPLSPSGGTGFGVRTLLHYLSAI